MSPKPDQTDGLYRTRIPADVGAPDKVVYGLTFRQLAILAVAAVAGWAGYNALQTMLPVPVLAGLGIVWAAAAFGVAAGRRDGQPLDKWLLAGLRYARAPRALSTLTTNVALPGWVDPPEGKPVIPAPLRLPAEAIDSDGTISLEGGETALVAMTGLNLGLRSHAEQTAAIDLFGGWLNSLTAPAQIVVSAQPADLAGHAAMLREHAGSLPDPALVDACTDHAAFLEQLAARRDPLRRQILVAVNASGQGAARRLADDTARTLAGLGITTKALDGSAVTAAIAAAADPYRPPRPGRLAAPGQPITATNPSPSSRKPVP